MGDLDPLGFPRRARGIDDVGEVPRSHPALQGAIVLGRDGVAIPVERHDPRRGSRERGELREQLFLGQEKSEPRLLQHVGDPLPRILGVERHVGATGLQDAQEAHHQVERAFDGQAHEDLGADTQAAEVTGQPVGAGVEVGVGQPLAFELDRHRPRRPRRLSGDQLVQAAVLGELGRRGVPVRKQLARLGRGEPGELGERLLGIGGHPEGEGAEMVEEAADGDRVEEIGVVLQVAGEPFLFLDHVEGHLEPRGGVVDRQLRDGEPGDVERLARRVEEDEESLEDGRPGEVSLRVDLVDQLLERQILVGVGAERHLPLAGDELAEGGIAREVGAESERVGEKADDPLELGPGAIGDQGAERQVLLPRVVMEEGLPGGGQADVERPPLGLAEPGQRLDHRSLQKDRFGGAVVGAQSRPRTVRHEVEGRGAGEALAPVGELALQHLARQPLALPEGKVQILDRQLGERRGLARCESAIERRQLGEEDPPRPAVVDDVVDVQKEQVLLLPGAEEESAEERSQSEIERAPGILVGETPGGRLALCFGKVGPVAEVGQGQLDEQPGGNELHGLAVHRLEGRAERLVAGDDRLQGLAEDLRRQRTGDPEALRDVVLRALRLVLVQEPEPRLSEGEPEEAGSPAGARDRRPDGSLALLLPPQLLEEERPLFERQLRDAFRQFLLIHCRQSSSRARSAASSESSVRAISRAMIASERAATVGVLKIAGRPSSMRKASSSREIT